MFCGISVLSGIYLDRVSLLLLFYPNVPVASESNDGYPSKKVATVKPSVKPVCLIIVFLLISPYLQQRFRQVGIYKIETVSFYLSIR